MNFFFQSSIKFFFVNDDNSWVTFWMIILSDCEWIFNQPFIHLKFFLFTEKKILWNLISIVDFKYVWSVVVSVCLFLCHISFSKSNPVLVWLLFDLIHCYCCCCLSMETTVTYFFFCQQNNKKLFFFLHSRNSIESTNSCNFVISSSWIMVENFPIFPLFSLNLVLWSNNNNNNQFQKLPMFVFIQVYLFIEKTQSHIKEKKRKIPRLSRFPWWLKKNQFD